MDYSVNIDGQLTAQQTEDRCEAEQAGGFKLDSVVHSTLMDGNNIRLINKAAFDLATPDLIFTNLEFSVLGANDPDQVRTQMKAQGWVFICDSHIYVAGTLQRVLIFGKN
ncbi:MAG TPA: hypothetical protein PLL77_10840 [Pyrinomonadaceae bacterium]|nr:hypothetical protein [Pyrinomonadaceae bacterium]